MHVLMDVKSVDRDGMRLTHGSATLEWALRFLTGLHSLRPMCAARPDMDRIIMFDRSRDEARLMVLGVVNKGRIAALYSDLDAGLTEEDLTACDWQILIFDGDVRP